MLAALVSGFAQRNTQVRKGRCLGEGWQNAVSILCLFFELVAAMREAMGPRQAEQREKPTKLEIGGQEPRNRQMVRLHSVFAPKVTIVQISCAPMQKWVSKRWRCSS